VAAGQIFPLSDGSALQVTVFRLESPLGRDMNHVGVEPDESVERTAADVHAGRDPQLEAGVAYLAEVLKEASRQPW
jgi:C-terminal processing protease CtpA/Prc